MILCDTRQQPGKHQNIDKYFERSGIATARQALYVGDYIIANDGSRAVDTKQDVIELAGNILSGDHERFQAECRRPVLKLPEASAFAVCVSCGDGNHLSAAHAHVIHCSLLFMSQRDK